MTLNLSSEKMMELAKIMEPDNHWEILGGTVVHGDIVRGGWIELGQFCPDLEGSDQERLQALSVIVAASRLKYFHLMQWADGFTVEYVDGDGNEISTPVCADILTASAKALIASRGKG